MMHFLARFWERAKLLFWAVEVVEPVVAVAEPVPVLVAPLKPKKPERLQYDGKESFGRFYFKKAILDDLGRYFQYINRMKKIDRDSYDLYSKVGANLTPAGMVMDLTAGEKVSPWFHSTRPSFGCTAFCGKDDRDTTIAWVRFVYFRKYDREGAPRMIQPVNVTDDVYILTIFYDDKGLQKGSAGGCTVDIPIAVAQDGRVRVLKTKQTVSHKLPKSPNRKGHLPDACVRRQEWDYSSQSKVWARSLVENGLEGDVVDFSKAIFRMVTVSVEGLNSSMIRVSASKGASSALFGVDIERTPYFFKDRDEVVVGGVKKNIFHIVRPHLRASGGKETKIKMHFRGLKQFVWNGYEINISVPGKDHMSIAEFPVAAIYVDKDDPRVGEMMGSKALGKYLGDYAKAAS